MTYKRILGETHKETYVVLKCTSDIHTPYVRPTWTLFGPKNKTTKTNQKKTHKETYGLATISRLLKIIGLFCKRAL